MGQVETNHFAERVHGGRESLPPWRDPWRSESGALWSDLRRGRDPWRDPWRDPAAELRIDPRPIPFAYAPIPFARCAPYPMRAGGYLVRLERQGAWPGVYLRSEWSSMRGGVDLVGDCSSRSAVDLDEVRARSASLSRARRTPPRAPIGRILYFT